jgi:dipeptide transport system substrate-binding protein
MGLLSKKKKQMRTLVLLRNKILCLLILGCQQVYGQTLNVCLDSPILTLDPHSAEDSSSIDAVHLKIFEPLIKFSGKRQKLVGVIAKSWSTNDKKDEYTFQLKSGIKFHRNKLFKPTRDLQAEDIIFTFKRQTESELYSVKYHVFKNMGLHKLIKKIEAVGNYQVKFKLRNSSPDFLDILKDHVGAIMSKEYYWFLKKRNMLEQFELNPIGTGPFQYVSNEGKNFLSMKRFKSYHGKKVRIEKMQFKTFSNNETRMEMLEQGSCDIVHNPNPFQLRKFTNDPDYKILTYSYTNMLYLTFNTKKKPFDRVEIRKAVAHALNLKKYNAQIFAGYGKIANHVVTPNIEGYSNTFFPLEYDVQKAKELMRKGGYPNGFRINFWTLPVPRIYCPDGKKLAEMMEKDLKKIGIKVKIIIKPFEKYLKQTAKGQHHLLLIGWTDGFANEILNDLTCASTRNSTNRSFWCNKNYDNYVANYFVTQGKSKKKFLDSATREFYREMPWFPMYYTSKLKIIRSRVKRFYPIDETAEDYATIRLAKER